MILRFPPVGFALATFVLLAGCSVVPKTPPAPPPPAPAPAPAPPPPSAPDPAPALTWDVAPVAPGDWSYRRDGADSIATFRAPDGAPRLLIRCAAATRQLQLGISGAVGGRTTPVTIRTSNGDLRWTAEISPADARALAGMVITRPATDPGFDWIAYSRGRISVEVGSQRIIVPDWAEISRVIEDCRG